MNNETTKNLIPQSERTKDEQREIARTVVQKWMVKQHDR